MLVAGLTTYHFTVVSVCVCVCACVCVCWQSLIIVVSLSMKTHRSQAISSV